MVKKKTNTQKIAELEKSLAEAIAVVNNIANQLNFIGGRQTAILEVVKSLSEYGGIVEKLKVLQEEAEEEPKLDLD